MARTRTENLEHLRRTFRPVEPGQKYVVDSFRPEDAEGIAALFMPPTGKISQWIPCTTRMKFGAKTQRENSTMSSDGPRPEI